MHISSCEILLTVDRLLEVTLRDLTSQFFYIDNHSKSLFFPSCSLVDVHSKTPTSPYSTKPSETLPVSLEGHRGEEVIKSRRYIIYF